VDFDKVEFDPQRLGSVDEIASLIEESDARLATLRSASSAVPRSAPRSSLRSTPHSARLPRTSASSAARACAWQRVEGMGIR
jgi:hypothetical protein